MRPNNIDTKELNQCPVKAHQKRCDDQKKRILRDAIIERGQHFGRVTFRNTWGHRIYARIGGDQLFLDLPEEGTLSFEGSNLSPASHFLPKKS